MAQKPSIFPHTLTLCLPLARCAVLLPSRSGMAQTQPFTAQYQVSEASDADGKVEVTMTVRIDNNGTSDVNSATLSVANPVAKENFGTFDNISVVKGGSARVSQSLSIPQRFYQQWQKGANPLLNLDYTDENGKPVHQIFPALVVAAGHSL